MPNCKRYIKHHFSPLFIQSKQMLSPMMSRVGIDAYCLRKCILLFAFSLSACGGDDCAQGAKDCGATTTWSGATLENGVVNSKLQGAWRVAGEGTLYDINASGVTQYIQTQTLCYLDPAPMDGLVLAMQNTTLRGTGNVVDIFTSPDQPSYKTLERLDTIPASCRTPLSATGSHIFTALWEAFALDYAFFVERHIDWPARYAQFKDQAGQALTEEAQFAVLQQALQGLNDSHVNLARLQNGQIIQAYNAEGEHPTKTLLQHAFTMQDQVKSQQEFNSLFFSKANETIQARIGGNARALNDKLLWGKLENNIGYIQINAESNFSKDSTLNSDLSLIKNEMDKAITSLADSPALILDLTFNSGGYDLVSQEIAGHFADQQRLVYTKIQQRPQGRASQPWFISPRGKTYTKPVYVLTSDMTVSAGETLTLMLRTLPHITHTGQTTNGAFSDLLVKRLPGNFLVTLSNERYTAADGKIYEISGIPPQQPLQIFDTTKPELLFSGHDMAISQLLKQIK